MFQSERLPSEVDININTCPSEDDGLVCPHIKWVDIDKTPDYGHLRPKHVVMRRNKSENSCFED